MVDVITPRQLTLLSLVAKHPGLEREKLLVVGGPTAAADLAYLEQHDLVRKREPGRYRVSHFGDLALKRGR